MDVALYNGIRQVIAMTGSLLAAPSKTVDRSTRRVRIMAQIRR